MVTLDPLDPLDPWFKSPLSTRSAGPAQTLRLLRHLGGSASVPALLPAALGALAKQRATQEAMTLVDDAVGRRVRRGGRPYRVIPPCCAMIGDPRVKYSL